MATFIKAYRSCGSVYSGRSVALGFRNQELVAALIMLASPTTVTSYVMAKSMDNDEVLSSSIIVAHNCIIKHNPYWLDIYLKNVRAYLISMN